MMQHQRLKQNLQHRYNLLREINVVAITSILSERSKQIGEAYYAKAFHTECERRISDKRFFLV